MGRAQTRETKEKIRNGRLGRKHTSQSVDRIKKARVNQKPPRKKRETKKAKREKESIEKRLLRLIKDDADFEGENPGDPLETPIEKILRTIIKDGTPWLDKALETFNFDISLNAMRREADTFIRRVEISRKAKTPQKRMFFFGAKSKVEQLADIYVDVSQDLGGAKKNPLEEKGRIAIADTRYWKALLRLNSILGSLGIRSAKDIRMYMKGVSIKKRLKSRKIVPINTLSSPLCVFDFLIFLKETWYERHLGSKWEDYYRERDFGQSYYLKTANQALGLLNTNISFNQGSIFSAEIPSSLGFGAGKEEFIAYYIYSCSVFGLVFWKQGWLKEINPDMHDLLDSIEERTKDDVSLCAVLKILEKVSDERWKASGIPYFVEDDEDNLLWVTESQDMQKEMWLYLQSNECYQNLRG